MKKSLLLPALLTVAAVFGTAPPLAASCSTQLDFLAGNWVVRDRTGRVLGIDSVSKQHGGCGLVELWREAGSGKEGLGVFSYRPGTATWHQDLMTHVGFVLSVKGTMDGASMVMTGKEYPGRGVTRIHRIRWTPTSDGSVEQLWETSIDDRRSWQVHFEGHFQRISE